MMLKAADQGKKKTAKKKVFIVSRLIPHPDYYVENCIENSDNTFPWF
jgi:hypothetical protein